MREHIAEHIGRHRHALILCALALGAGAAVAAVTVSIATGHTARSTAVFARTSRLAASHGVVGPGLSLDGAAVAEARAGGKRTLGILGGGDEVIAPLTGSLTPVGVATPDGAYLVYSSWKKPPRTNPDGRGRGLRPGNPAGGPAVGPSPLAPGKER